MAAIPAPAETTGFGRRGWIQSPAWDSFWMFSALWGAALILLGTAAQPLATLLLGLLALERLISVLHAWSTTYMVVFSPLLAEERRANRRRYLWFPAGIALFSLGLGLVVSATQRYPADGRPVAGLWPFALYIGLFWVGHFWHFGNQDFGVLNIYRTLAGQKRPLDRRVDKLFTVAMMYVIQPVVYLSAVTTTAFAELTSATLGLTPAFLGAAARLAIGAACLLSAGVAVFELSKPNRSLPRLLYMLVILLHPTLLYAAVAARAHSVGLLYVFAYLWSHWLIAIGLVGRINARFYASRGDSPGRAVLRHAAVLLFIAGLVYVATQRHAQYLLFNTDGFRYKQLLAAITPEQTMVVGLVLGFFLGEQLVHYYCDRCLFRLRNPGVRRQVAPLLLGDAPR
jgi:hypothetical protein